MPYILLMVTSFMYGFYIIFLVFMRKYHIRKLDEEFIKKEDKLGYLKVLSGYIYTSLLFSMIGIIGWPFVLFQPMLSLVFPVMAVVFLAKVHSKIIDEIDVYDVRRRDVEKLLKFEKEIRVDAARKNRIQENHAKDNI